MSAENREREVLHAHLHEHADGTVHNHFHRHEGGDQPHDHGDGSMHVHGDEEVLPEHAHVHGAANRLILEAEGVSFSYPRSAKPVFEDREQWGREVNVAQPACSYRVAHGGCCARM